MLSVNKKIRFQRFTLTIFLKLNILIAEIKTGRCEG